MSSEENTLFDNITTLIDKNDYAKAENELKLIISTETSSEEAISYAHYLIGYINTCWRNEDKKESLAKRMLLACINSNYPFPNAYFLYANQEEDKNIACNYLKAGLSKFPKSAKIYLGILNHCPKNETINYINEIDDKNIIDIDLFNKVIEILIAISNWEKVEVFINKLLKQKYISEHYYLYYKMLYSLSLVKQNKDIERAKELFLEVIGKDLSNDLNYSPYMGYIWCCIKMNMSEEAIKYFDKIPISNGLGDLHNGLNNISVNLDFIDIYIHIFREIGNIFKDDKKRMLRLAAMEAFYLYKPSEITENYRYTKKNLAALKRYIKTDSINMDIYCAIFNMQKHFNLYFDAYKTYMQMLNEQLNPLDGYIYIDFFDESSAQENERIYLDILGVLDTGYYLDYDGFVSGVFDCIVEYLFNLSDKKRYNKICALADKVKYKYLDKSAELFKVAYSYAELDNKCKKAERLYLLLLENQPNSTAVLNNLGVIYKRRNEIQKAKEYFKKAHDLDSDDKLYANNLNDANLTIKENEKSLKNLQEENAWFLGRLQRVYEAACADGILECTYKNRPLILGVAPKKADEIFDHMCKCGYLTKEYGDSQSPSKFMINPLVKEYLLKENERIEGNRVYESLIENLNVDEIEKVGYTKELQGLFKNINNSDLRDILLRDIRECVISLLANQYKSCIVICGSIIEAILVDRVIDSGISKYDIGMLLNKKAKTKAVKNMDLNELIELARAENVINLEEYHLSNYVRYYRNIIHPSYEVRKNYEVNEEKARLMWGVLLEIVRGLLK